MKITLPRMVRCTILGVGACTLLAACSDDSASASKKIETMVEPSSLVDPGRIDATLKGFVDRGELIGISALVYEHGNEAYFGAFGLADREANRPMRRDTLTQIFSMTKPITGVTLMTFYEEGRFELDDPLENYLPEYKDIRLLAGEKDGEPVLVNPARKPTIRDITRHTAGFTNDDAADTSAARRLFREINPLEVNNTLEQMSLKLAGIPLFYEPGTRWFYGPSADVQARLVEVLSGRKFADVMRERVLDPLNMTDTQYTLRPEQRDRITASYWRNPDGSFDRMPDETALETQLKDVALTPGGWGLSSTLDDYMRFIRMLLNGGELDGVRILQPETVRLMASDALPADVTDTLWLRNKGQVGFGIDFAVRIAPPIDQAESSGAVGEFFWDGAANTLFWIDPKNDIAAVQFNFYRPWGKVDMQKDFRDAVYYRDAEANAMNKAPAGPNSKRGSD